MARAVLPTAVGPTMTRGRLADNCWDPKHHSGPANTALTQVARTCRTRDLVLCNHVVWSCVNDCRGDEIARPSRMRAHGNVYQTAIRRAP